MELMRENSAFAHMWPDSQVATIALGSAGRCLPDQRRTIHPKIQCCPTISERLPPGACAQKFESRVMKGRIQSWLGLHEPNNDGTVMLSRFMLCGFLRALSFTLLSGVRDIRVEHSCLHSASMLHLDENAVTMLLVLAVPIFWRHQPTTANRETPNAATAAREEQDTEAQIAEDNELMRSVDMALSASEESPLAEYHLASGPHPLQQPRPKLRKP